LFEHPSKKLSLIAVTGTNGKTSISHWIGNTHPKKCSIIGTLGAGDKDGVTYFGYTTPKRQVLVDFLNQFIETGSEACALEASSFSLMYGRLYHGVKIDIAIFTNLTRDHLDYHPTMEDYADAKRKLFLWPDLRLSIINLDDPFGRELIQKTTAKTIVGYTQTDAEYPGIKMIRAKNVVSKVDGLEFDLYTYAGNIKIVTTNIIGYYNVSNLLAVIGVLLDSGVTLKDIAKKLYSLKTPMGRLEFIKEENKPLVIVDFAHSPDAYEKVIPTVRKISDARNGKLIVVFGCAGGRDKGKRPLMGKIVSDLADVGVVTSNIPRDEDPLQIIGEITEVMNEPIVIPDRIEAINTAIKKIANVQDVVLILGQGFPNFQENMIYAKIALSESEDDKHVS
jgi:UDP-N-acetylmuramyl-tripeptide synthetase